jgi:hypothetical protein
VNFQWGSSSCKTKKPPFRLLSRSTSWLLNKRSNSRACNLIPVQPFNTNMLHSIFIKPAIFSSRNGWLPPKRRRIDALNHPSVGIRFPVRASTTTWRRNTNFKSISCLIHSNRLSWSYTITVTSKQLKRLCWGRVFGWPAGVFADED